MHCDGVDSSAVPRVSEECKKKKKKKKDYPGNSSGIFTVVISNAICIAKRPFRDYEIRDKVLKATAWYDPHRSCNFKKR